MSQFEIRAIDRECASCGGKNFSAAEPGNPNSQIVCDTCGQPIGTVAEVNADAAARGRGAMPDIEEAIKDALKRVKGFKPR